MAKILDLIPRLKNVAEAEEDIFRGARPREFFIELFGAGSLEDMLEAFTPDYHNAKWEEQFQRIKQNSVDESDMMRHRRAVAYMRSGRTCCKRRYWEDELKLGVMGVARMEWVLYGLEELNAEQKEDSPNRVWRVPESGEA